MLGTTDHSCNAPALQIALPLHAPQVHQDLNDMQEFGQLYSSSGYRCDTL